MINITHMTKFTKIAASGALALLVLPSIALAHDGRDERGIGASIKEKIRLAISDNRHDDDDDEEDENEHKRQVRGTVTAKAVSGFDVRTKDGTVFSVLVNSDTKIVGPFGKMLTLANISVDDTATVKGVASSSQITASMVIVTPKNTHPAVAKGKVTAVSGNAITLQSQNHGVVYSVTVNTNASTTVQTAGGATTTSAIQVGSKISAKGLWDELLNVLNAIKIRIF